MATIVNFPGLNKSEGNAPPATYRELIEITLSRLILDMSIDAIESKLSGDQEEVAAIMAMTVDLMNATKWLLSLPDELCPADATEYPLELAMNDKKGTLAEIKQLSEWLSNRHRELFGN